MRDAVSELRGASMKNRLRYNISDSRLTYSGRHEPMEMSKDKISTFNLRHQEVLGFYDLELVKGTVFVSGQWSL